MNSHNPTLEQQRAADALKAVQVLQADPRANDKQRSNYRSYAEALPASIVMNGLGQACATLLSAANGDGDRERAYRSLHQHLQAWLCRKGGVFAGENSLIDAIVKHGQAEYVHAQAEALAYLVWLKKFAQAFLPHGGNRDA